MKKLKILVAVLVILGGVGYGVYRVGLNMASDKLIENVSKELETSGELAKIKKSIENDPNLRKSMEHDQEFKTLVQRPKSNLVLTSTPVVQKSARTVENVKPESPIKPTMMTKRNKLPFNTKEEATKVLLAKVGLTELKSMYSKVKAGTMTKDEVLQVLRSKLSQDEITALKLVAYKEISKS